MDPDRRRLAQGWLAAIAVALVLVGCSDQPFEYVKIKGDVLYEDGSVIPADSIELWFATQMAVEDEMLHPRPARAGVNVADGTFDTVTSSEYGDGLVAGKHKVAIFAYQQGQVGDAVDKKFSNGATTTIVIDTADSPIEIRVPKP